MAASESDAWQELAAALKGQDSTPFAGIPAQILAAVTLGEPNGRRALTELLLQRGHLWGHVLEAEARGGADPAGRRLADEALGADGALTWDHGVITEAVLAPKAVNAEQPLHVVLQRLLEHPAGHFVKKLTLALPPYPSLRVERNHAADLEHLSTALEGARPAVLAELELRPARAPRLEHLALRKTDVSTVASIATLLEGSSLPALARLRLTNSQWGVKLLEALATCPLLARLETLDLSNGVLGSGAIKVFKTHVAAFEHLRSLTLTGNYFSASELASLERLLPQIESGAQRAFDSARGRYTSAGE